MRDALGVVALAADAEVLRDRHGLPVAGQTGTLIGRFAGTTLVGRLRAKTGHIDGVVGLAGIIEARADGPTPASASRSSPTATFRRRRARPCKIRSPRPIGGFLDAPAATNLVPATEMSAATPGSAVVNGCIVRIPATRLVRPT